MNSSHAVLTRRYVRSLSALHRVSMKFDPESEKRFRLYERVCKRIFNLIYWEEAKR